MKGVVIMSGHEQGQPLTTEQARGAGSADSSQRRVHGLLMTVEQVALLWFGEVGRGGSASSNCQKIRRLIPDVLPARRIGNRWYVSRAAAEAWAQAADSAIVMAHPATRALDSRPVEVQAAGR
jgi:hypothetical protein